VGPLRDPDRRDPAVIGLGHSISGTGSTRSITISAFSFQASEFGKVLLIVFLAAFVVDSSRKTSGRELVARVMLLALAPAMPRDRRAGPGLRSRLHRGCGRRALHLRRRVAASRGARRAGCRRVPGGRGGDAGGRYPRPAHPGVRGSRPSCILPPIRARPATSSTCRPSDRIGREARPRRGHLADHARARARAHNRLHLRGDRRAFRLRWRRGRSIAVRTGDSGGRCASWWPPRTSSVRFSPQESRRCSRSRCSSTSVSRWESSP